MIYAFSSVLFVLFGIFLVDADTPLKAIHLWLGLYLIFTFSLILNFTDTENTIEPRIKVSVPTLLDQNSN